MVCAGFENMAGNFIRPVMWYYIIHIHSMFATCNIEPEPDPKINDILKPVGYAPTRKDKQLSSSFLPDI